MQVDMRFAYCGTAVHKAIEKEIKGEPLDHEELTKELDKDMEDRYRFMLERFHKLNLTTEEPRTEVWLESQVQGLRLVGIVDLIDGTTAYDWKTGKPKIEDEVQASVYHRLLTDNGIENPTIKFVYLGKKEVRRMPVYPTRFVDSIVTTLKSSWDAGHFPAKPGSHCRFCEYEHLCP